MALNFKWSLLIVLVLCISSALCRTRVNDLYVTTNKGKKKVEGNGYFHVDALYLYVDCLYESQSGRCKKWSSLTLPIVDMKYSKGSKCNTNDKIYEVNVYNSDGDHTREIANLKYYGQYKSSNKIYISFYNGCRIEGRFNYSFIEDFHVQN